MPEGYSYDPDYLEELKKAGFEIGVHGLKHDGWLFLSRRLFRKRVKKINAYLTSLGGGFRSPLTHRHPEWMQDLKLQYDSSFFDVDPFESMPGGVGWLWPFFIGNFLELPYTLPQDNTLFNILGEKTPLIWQKSLKKMDLR